MATVATVAPAQITCQDKEFCLRRGGGAEGRVDSDVGFEYGRARTGVLDRPLVFDRAGDADPPFDTQTTEPVPEEPPVGEDLGGTETQLAGAGRTSYVEIWRVSRA
jgi:hypothetical protein